MMHPIIKKIESARMEFVKKRGNPFDVWDAMDMIEDHKCIWSDDSDNEDYHEVGCLKDPIYLTKKQGKYCPHCAGLIEVEDEFQK